MEDENKNNGKDRNCKLAPTGALAAIWRTAKNTNLKCKES